MTPFLVEVYDFFDAHQQTCWKNKCNCDARFGRPGDVLTVLSFVVRNSSDMEVFVVMPEGSIGRVWTMAQSIKDVVFWRRLR